MSYNIKQNNYNNKKENHIYYICYNNINIDNYNINENNYSNCNNFN